MLSWIRLYSAHIVHHLRQPPLAYLARACEIVARLLLPKHGTCVGVGGGEVGGLNFPLTGQGLALPVRHSEWIEVD